MSDYLIQDTTITGLANQARRIAGSEDTFTPAELAELFSKVNGEVVSGSQYEVKAIDPFTFTEPIKSGIYDEGMVFATPTPKEYENVTFDKWIAPEPFDGRCLTINDQPINVGALYKPTSGNLEIYVNTINGTTVNFGWLNTPQYIDWGDGTVEEFDWVSEYTHTYAERNKLYRIQCINPRRDGSLFVENTPIDTRKMIYKIIYPSTQACVSIGIGEGSVSNEISIAEGVTEIKYRLYFDKNDNSLQLSDWPTFTGLKCIVIPGSVLSIGDSAFFNEINLRDVVLGYGVQEICESCFRSCQSLKNIVIPNTVTTIGYSAFRDSGLTEIVIPENTTTIGHSAFSGCTSLTKAIYKSSAKLSDNIFNGCTSLRSFIIEYDGGVISNGSSSLVGTPIWRGELGYYLYVPDALLDEYKANTTWSTIAKYIKPISEYVETTE